MSEEIRTLVLTKDEVTLLFWLTGFGGSKLPKTFTIAYANLTQKLCNISY